MDSSYHHQQQQQQQQQNWLAFSLSNQHRLPSDSSQLCLFEAFHQNPSRTDLSNALNCCNTTSNNPKLEDFLGGAAINNNNDNNGSTTSSTDICQHHHLSTETTTSSSSAYDSELKSIAASFLRGYATTTTISTAVQHSEELRKQLLPLPPSDSPPPPPPLTATAKKPAETFGQRTSIYRGVTRHRWTGRYEAHLWDNTCRREGQSRKGRQVYLGGYDKEDKAARAYDLAALKYWGPTTTTNFPVSNYEKELEEMKHMTRQEFVASLRRKSSGFSRGASIYRGVTRHHQHGRWQARIGRVAGNKDLYLGTFSTQEEAAEAYDIAAIKFRGLNAVTNFDISRYDVKSIASSNLPIGGGGGTNNNNNNNKSKTSSSSESLSDHNHNNHHNSPVDLDLDCDRVRAATTFPCHSFGLPAVKQQAEESGQFWSSLGQYHDQGQGYNNIISDGKNPNMLFFPSNNSNNVSATTLDVVRNMNTNPNTNATTTRRRCNNNDNSNNNGYLMNRSSSNSSYLDEQQNTRSTVVPVVTRIALNSNQLSSGTFDGTSYGNWISASSSTTPAPAASAAALHSFQTAKQNLSVVFQTPIFGME